MSWTRSRVPPLLMRTAHHHHQTSYPKIETNTEWRAWPPHLSGRVYEPRSFFYKKGRKMSGSQLEACINIHDEIWDRACSMQPKWLRNMIPDWQVDRWSVSAEDKVNPCNYMTSREGLKMQLIKLVQLGRLSLFFWEWRRGYRIW